MDRRKTNKANTDKTQTDRGAFDPTKILYDPELPIVGRREEIAALIRENQVVVICGETGSGKSTQLPKICLEIGRGAEKMIGHTQPRRIAARSLATRIAEELGTPPGQTVGCKIRFSDHTSPATRIKLMTDGILLAESRSDRFFDRYDTIIIDEAHERSLNIDFLLGIIKRILPKRPDLKLLITSATLDAQRFSEHFRDKTGKAAPVIEVSGRAWPIEILYRPPREYVQENEDNGEFADDEPDMGIAVQRAVEECTAHGGGDILVFMPTERDILETAKRLRSQSFRAKTEILPLYARLPSREQQKIFAKLPCRKIVIATNVAESSLTVPGIRFVVDTGTARISRYSSRSRTQRLPIEAVSQASADQRAGRCGRVGPGVCIRLYNEADYRGRARYTTPEIQRTNLASVILQTKAFRLGPVERFPFIDPPRSAAVTDGYKTLREIGALDDRQELTDIGRRLARLPLDPRIGRMLLAAEEEGCLREMLIIAAALEIQDPRERPQDQREKADAAHEQFLDPRSDFLAFLNLWEFYRHLKSTLSHSQLRKACRQNFLSFNRLREWGEIHVQIQSELRETLDRKRTSSPFPSKRSNTDSSRPDEEGVRKTDYAQLYAPLHRAILTGLLSGIAQREDRGEYAVAGGGRFVLWPGSGVFKSKQNYRWILAAERLETTRKYLRTVAQIDTNWVEPLAAHLLHRTCMEPHWDRETGYVHAYERLTLFGLTIVPRRRINFGPIDPRQARNLFIQHALVEEEIDTDVDFVLRNGETLEQARKLQDKLRRYDLLHGEGFRYEFYQDRLPDEVHDRRSLEKWWKTAPPERRRSLYWSLDELCTTAVDAETLRLFPDMLDTGAGPLPLDYVFHPGGEDDGLSLTVPVEGLRQLQAEPLGWLVPGLLERKITALLRALPKELRRSIVPIPDTAKRLARDFLKEPLSGSSAGSPVGGALEERLAREVSRLSGRAVRSEDFRAAEVPAELRLNIRVSDAGGEILMEGRDLDTLRRELGVKASETLATVEDPRWHADNLTDWTFGDLPESISLQRGQTSFPAYPTLFLCPGPQGGADSVQLRLTDTPAKADRQTRRALVRLVYLKLRRDITTQVKWIPNFAKLRTYASHLPDFDPETEIGELIAARALDIERLVLPRSEGGFRQALAQSRERLGVAVQDVTRLVGPLLEAAFQVRLHFEKETGRFTASRDDAQDAFARLVAPGFLLDTPWTWLREYPRYFKAIPLRWEKLKSGGEPFDRQAVAELAAYRQRLEERQAINESAGRFDPELETFRWMLEEYRVSLFAQKLGTAVKVSSQRLEKQWEKCAK